MLPGTIGKTVKSGGQAISYIGNAGKNVATGSAGVTITYNASSAEGDFLVLVAQTDDAFPMSTPSGWTQESDIYVSGFVHTYLFYKTKSSDTTVFCTAPTVDHITCTVLTFRNVDTYTPKNVKSEYSVGDNTSQTLTGVTTTVDACYVLWLVGHDAPTEGTVFSNWTNANITGSAELIDISTTDSWDGGVGVWGGIKTLAGATGSTTVTVDSLADSMSVLCYAMNPAP